jgi:hypothetical protein
MNRLILLFFIALVPIRTFGEDARVLGHTELVLESDLYISPNTIYAEVGKASYSSAETRSYIGYGIYTSFWRVTTDLCQAKMFETSVEKRKMPKNSMILLSGHYQEYEQDGYLVQEFFVVSPKDVESIICYSHCDEYKSLLGVEARKVSSFSGGKVTLERFKNLLRKKASINLLPPELIISSGVE